PALLVVAPCRRQTLRVIDPRGAPLAGAQVEVANRALVDFPQVLEHAQEQRFGDATTDADGRAAWPCLPLQATTVAISCRGFAPQFFAVDASTPPDLLVMLQPMRDGARLIGGVVTDARGAWVAGASVGLGNRRTTADDHGHFVLALAPGEQVRDDEPLHAHAPSWYPAIIRGFGARVNAAGERTWQQDLELRQRVLEIAGQVLDDRGQPCAGVLVHPWQLDLLTDQESAEDFAMPVDAPTMSLAGNPIRAFTRTDDAGRFLLSGLGDTDYRLRVHDDRALWGHTTPPIAGGSSGVTIRLPTAPMGPVAGRVTTRAGTPAAGVRLRGHVEVHANGGGMAGSGVPVSATTDAEGRFRVDRMPRLGVQLTFTGDEWIDHSVALAEQADPEALQVSVLRRCHVRVECTGAAWADAWIEFQDANGGVLLITERRRSTVMSRDSVELHRGKTGVFAISEAATTMVLRTPDGKRQQRVPVVPRPGEVTAFVHNLD
ncbi:MAG: carboxypeptidase-like regulatory domain-containing protein, partial [Planctomycetota bacterium]